MKLVKGAKKVLDIADPVLESPILMKSPRESSMLESQEEFYDAIMADEPEEEEDEFEENALVNCHQVYHWLFQILMFQVLKACTHF